jgi:hypothetical protein
MTPGLFPELSGRDPKFSGKERVAVRICLVLNLIQRMGAVAPIPPRARSATAPDGAPPRRIKGGENLTCPAAPREGP